jgi:hypothetical protein
MTKDIDTTIETNADAAHELEMHRLNEAEEKKTEAWNFIIDGALSVSHPCPDGITAQRLASLPLQDADRVMELLYFVAKNLENADPKFHDQLWWMQQVFWPKWDEDFLAYVVERL